MRSRPTVQIALLVGVLSAGLGAGRALSTAEHAALEGEARSEPKELSSAFREVVRRVGPSVVGVRSYGTVTTRGRTFGPRRLAQGSGVIVREDGIVATNHHVVAAGLAAEDGRVRVVLDDGSEVSAEVLGIDDETDLAVLRVLAGDRSYNAASFAPAESAEIGEWVVAIGNPYGLGVSVTQGIVSGTGRTELDITTFEDFLQTDAAINPGNSGGPLVDLEGRVVGINTAKGTLSEGSIGLGFSIPARIVEQVVDGILAHGRVQRGFLGVEMSEIPASAARALGIEGGARVVVSELVDGGPARAAGVEEGDVVLAIGGREVHRTSELLFAIGDLAPGTEVTLALWRRGETLRKRVTLADRDDY